MNQAQSHPYVFGQAEKEIYRLEHQSHLWDPLTLQVLQAAGITEGMRVLDLGCGPGDVSLMLAQLVGANGSVCGVDQNASFLQHAQTRAQQAGLVQISFLTGRLPEDLPQLFAHQQFDAVVGRAILHFVPDLRKLLQAIREILRPGGLLIFHEPDALLTELITNHQGGSPLLHRCRTWLREAFEQAGHNVQVNLTLASTLQEAGFPPPHMQVTGVAGTSADRHIAEWITLLIASLFSQIVQGGIASEKEIELETLTQRIQEEMSLQGGYQVAHLLLGVWTNKEIGQELVERQ